MRRARIAHVDPTADSRVARRRAVRARRPPAMRRPCRSRAGSALNAMPSSGSTERGMCPAAVSVATSASSIRHRAPRQGSTPASPARQARRAIRPSARRGSNGTDASRAPHAPRRRSAARCPEGARTERSDRRRRPGPRRALHRLSVVRAPEPRSPAASPGRLPLRPPARARPARATRGASRDAHSVRPEEHLDAVTPDGDTVDLPEVGLSAAHAIECRLAQEARAARPRGLLQTADGRTGDDHLAQLVGDQQHLGDRLAALVARAAALPAALARGGSRTS